MVTSEQLALPRTRTHVPLGQCVLHPSSAENARKLLHGVGLAVREAEAGETTEAGGVGEGVEMSGMRRPLPFNCPSEVPSIDESMGSFVATAVLLHTARWSHGPILLTDRDSVDNPQFLASVYVANQVEDREGERVKEIAARAFLLPPARPGEVERRAEIAETSALSVPLTGGPPFSLTRHLENGERQRLRRMTAENQLAAITILAARGRSAAFVSPRGIWPTSMLISRLSHRLGCRIYRLGAEEIPEPIRSSLRTNRYLPTGG